MAKTRLHLMLTTAAAELFKICYHRMDVTFAQQYPVLEGKNF